MWIVIYVTFDMLSLICDFFISFDHDDDSAIAVHIFQDCLNFRFFTVLTSLIHSTFDLS